MKVSEDSIGVPWREAGKFLSANGVEIPQRYKTVYGVVLEPSLTRTFVRNYLRALDRGLIHSTFESQCVTHRLISKRLGKLPNQGSVLPLTEVQRFFMERGVPLPAEWQGADYRPPESDPGEALGVDGYPLPRVRKNHHGEDLPMSVPRGSAKVFFTRVMSDAQFERAIYTRFLRHVKLGNSCNQGTVITLGSIQDYAAELGLSLPREWRKKRGPKPTPAPTPLRPGPKAVPYRADPIVLATKWARAVEDDQAAARRHSRPFIGSDLKIELGASEAQAFAARARDLLPGMTVGFKGYGAYWLFVAEEKTAAAKPLRSPIPVLRVGRPCGAILDSRSALSVVE